jgi:hypothetical protein
MSRICRSGAKLSGSVLLPQMCLFYWPLIIPERRALVGCLLTGEQKKVCPSATLPTTDSTWATLGSRSRDSSELDGRRSIPRRGKIFFSTPVSTPALGPTQPSIQWVPGAHLAGLKRPGREADHSLHIVSRSRMVQLHLHSPIYIHGVVLN